MFQSLSGFPMSCNGVRLGLLPDILRVSIPIGFSNELQLITSSAGLTITTRFQSLSGFPMSCNRHRRDPHPEQHAGFNPYRVFQ